MATKSRQDQLLESHSNDPKQKGSFIRAARDILRVVKALPISETDPRIRFIILYGMCEKLAGAMDGTVRDLTVAEVYNSKYRVTVGHVSEACRAIEFEFDPPDIERIFDANNPRSARRLRNDFLHRPGPAHLKAIASSAPKLLPAMNKFLGGVDVLSRFVQKRI
jgi:hypothetical protein